MPTDSELLRRYTEDNDQRAFCDFVRNNLGLVHASAMRRTGGRSHLAEEVAQKVFCAASRKAAALARHPAITGWLYQTTRYAVLDALRAEKRREGLAHALTSMHDDPHPHELPADWERLRPLLDEELDALRESDRELMLLRFFKGLGYSEIGARLGLSENAARKRTDRALEALRSRLVRRGLTSTAAALSTTLAHAATTPAAEALATKIAAVALTSAPAGALSSLVTLLMMNKLTIPILSAALAAGLTTAVWSATHPDRSAEIAALEQDYGKLHKATSPQGTPAELSAAAAEYVDKSTAVTKAMAQRQARRTPAAGGNTSTESETSPQGYKNQGQATAEDTVYSFAWACDLADPEQLTKLTLIEEANKARAQQLLDSMPDAVRNAYPTPEQFYGFLLAAACIEAPPPNAALARNFMTLVELSPGRVATRRKGSEHNIHEYQLTPDGWKYVLPAAGIEGLPGILNSTTLAKLSRNP